MELTNPTDLAAVQAALAQGDGLSAAKLVGSAAAQISGALTSSAYYPTLHEAIDALDVSAYFNSDDQSNEGPYSGVKWIYKVTAEAPFFEEVREWANRGDVGLSKVANLAPNKMPISDDQQAAFTIKSRFEGAGTAIPPEVLYLNTGGCSVLGDGGGAEFVRTNTPQTDGAGWQSADGSWWQLTSRSLNVKMFGAVGDGITDDTVAIQKCADMGADVVFPWGTYKITVAIQLKAGQKVRGFNAANFNAFKSVSVENGEVGGGCFWYTADSSTGQVMAPSLANMSLRADYPIRFNDERTAVIADGAGNVPALMKPRLYNLDIKRRVAGVGIGVSMSKCFDGDINACLIQGFETNLLMNGCDLNRVANNRMQDAAKFNILELSAATFGSQNFIHHNDLLTMQGTLGISYKTTARHARFTDNYLEQASGALIGFIDASTVAVSSYAGNVSSGRLSSVIENNRIDQHARASQFVYRYEPAGQQYGSFIDNGHSGSSIAAPTFLMCDSTGTQVDELPFCFNQSNPAQFRFFGAKFGMWDGYQTNTKPATDWNGENLLCFGHSNIYNNRADQYLKARGKSLIFKNGFINAGDGTPNYVLLPLPVSDGYIIDQNRYIIEFEARCTAGSEWLQVGNLLGANGQNGFQATLTSGFQTFSYEFTANGGDAAGHGIFMRRSSNGASVIIRGFRLRKTYQIELPQTVASSVVFTVPTTRGVIDVRAVGTGNSLPASRTYRFVAGVLVETGSAITTPSSIDVTMSQSNRDITFTVTGAGTGKAISIGYNS